MNHDPANLLLTGGCLCGRVRYTARPDQAEGYYCHCRMCQLAFGNTRAAFINLRKDQVTWTASAPTYYVSSKIARRGFCGHCGTPLSFEFNDSPNMDLSIGSLDHPEVIKPVSHCSVETRIASWHAEDGLPGERLDEMQQITNRWRAAYGDAVAPGPDTARSRDDG
jgi:hypothetical protein